MKLNAYIAVLLALTSSLIAAPIRAAVDSAGTLAFVPNRGQWPDGVRSSVDAGPMRVWFEDDGWTLAVLAAEPPVDDLPPSVGRIVALRLRFLEADRQAELRPAERLPGWRNDLRGSDPSRWASQLPRHASQRWVAPYEGIDLVTRGDRGQLRYDLQLAAGADLSQVVVAVEGARGLRVDERGALCIETELGVVRQTAPITWAVLPDGGSVPVDCHFRLLGEGRFGFEAPDAAPDLPLVVDPTVQWSTYLGGDNIDYVFDSDIDANGRLVLVGFTHSPDYPTTLGSYSVSLAGSRDAFITCMESDGASLVYSTLLGGSALDEARAVDVSDDGSVVVGGLTSSANFPVGGATFGSSFSGGGALLGSDGFVVVLDGAGSFIQASGYVGGSQDDYVTAVAMGADGRAHFVGLTQSPDLPVTPGAFDPTYGGGGLRDGFVGRLGAGGSTLESLTYLGGSSNDVLNDLLVEDDGRVSVTGWTGSADFPVTSGAAQPTFAGFSDAILATFDASGSQLDYATFLGGSSNEDGLSLAAGAGGRLVIGGTTRSYDFPVAGAATDSSQAGGSVYGDGYLAVLAPDGASFEFATYLGGSGDDAVNAVCVVDGLLVAAGQSASADLFTTSDALDGSLGGALDAMLAVIDPEAGLVLYSTYVGGSANDRAWSLDVQDGVAVFAGYTNSDDLLVTAGAFDGVFDGTSTWITDGWAMSLDLGLSQNQSDAFVNLGFATAGTLGDPLLTVEGSLVPLEGGTLQVSNVPPGSRGLMLLSNEATYVPSHGGICVPCPVIVALNFRVGGGESISFPFMNSGNLPSGLALYAQAWVVDPAGPMGWAGTNAVQGIVP